MADNLFTAYNYLSSAIAQAFAALIALTAMFYIYRRQTIGNRKKETTEQMKPIYYEIKKEIDFPCSSSEVMIREHLFIQSKTGGEMLKIAKEHLNDNEALKELYEHYVLLDKQSRTFYWFILISISLSALAMISGIISLLVGPKLCENQMGPVMLIETLLAIFALGWTVIVVIRMLREPEEPKVKEVSPPP